MIQTVAWVLTLSLPPSAAPAAAQFAPGPTVFTGTAPDSPVLAEFDGDDVLDPATAEASGHSRPPPREPVRRGWR